MVKAQQSAWSAHCRRLVVLFIGAELAVFSAAAYADLWQCVAADGRVTLTNIEPRARAGERCSRLYRSPLRKESERRPASSAASVGAVSWAASKDEPQRRAILEHELMLEREAAAMLEKRLAEASASEREALLTQRERHLRNIAAIERELQRLR